MKNISYIDLLKSNPFLSCFGQAEAEWAAQYVFEEYHKTGRLKFSFAENKDIWYWGGSNYVKKQKEVDWSKREIEFLPSFIELCREKLTKSNPVYLDKVLKLANIEV